MKIKTILKEIGIFIIILAVAIYLRTDKLSTIPGWFKDEGNFINVTHNLLLGKWQHFAINGSPLIVGRPPLFFMALLPFFKLFGVDILVLRGFTVLGAILTLAFVYLTARQILGLGPAFFAALFLAIWPEAVFYNRIGETYNWLSPLFTIFVYSIWRYLDRGSMRWLILATVIAGISFGLEFLGVALIIILGLIVLFHEPHRLWVVIPLIAFIVILVWLPLVLTAPADTFFDLRFLFTNRANTGPFYIQFFVLFVNLGAMMRREVWIVVGLVGLFLLPDRRLRQLIWGLLVTFLILYAPSRVLGSHYLLPIMPFIAISIGFLISKMVPYILVQVKNTTQNWSIPIKGKSLGFTPFKGISGSILATLSVIFLFFIPLVWLFEVDMDLLVNRHATEDAVLINLQFPYLYEPVTDGEVLINFLTSKIGPTDVVNAPPNLAWALPGNLAGLDDLLSYEGKQSMFYPIYDRQRFAFDASLTNTKYVVVNHVWDQYSTLVVTQQILNVLKKWPKIFTQGDIQVFCNPNFCHGVQ